ncbi:MAG: hypothetical protein MUF34_27285, partial [Polyangiaceae bacterium]|nr:hypothetical protein [Polyangiaceae bacterium]
TQAKTKTAADTTKQPKKNAPRAQRRQAAKKATSVHAKKKAEQARRKDAAIEREDEGEAALAVPPDEAALAFARVQPELDAVPVAERGRIMIPIPVSVSIALGALPNLEAKRDEMKQAWPAYDVQRAARLREYAYAALYAHFRAQRPAEGASRLRALLDEAGPLRERLLLAAEVHAHYGDVDAGRVAAIRRGVGHQDTANDLVELAVLFRAARPALAGHTRVTDAEVARALALGTQIVDALGRRRVGTEEAAAPNQTEDDRVKAFWLFHDTYEESRRAMAHLRWYEGDADRLVPSLFSGRRRRGPAAEEPVEGETPVEPAEPAVPVEPVDPSEGN